MKKGRVAFFIVLITSIMVAFFVARTYIPKANLTWDEANHVYWTYKIYESLKSSNFPSFWEATVDQVHYPFLQSWIFGPILLFFGFSIEKVRNLGLFWFIVASLLLFILGKKLGGKRGDLVGLITSLLFIFSPMMIFYSSLFMREAMGVALSLTIILAFWEAESQKKPVYYLITGLLILGLTMTKYNYGIFLAGVLILGRVLSFVWPKEGGENLSRTSRLGRIRSLARRVRERGFEISSSLLIFLPPLLGTLFWIFLPNNKFANKPLFIWQILLDPKTSSQIGLEIDNFWSALTYYPKAILIMYSPSVVIGFFLLMGLILAIFFLRDWRIRVLWLAVTINLILGIRHFPNMQGRYIVIIMPFLFLMAAFIGVKMGEELWIFVRRKALFLGMVLGLGVIMGGKVVVDLWRLPSFVYALGAFAAGPIFNQADYRDTVDFEKGIFDFNASHWPSRPPSGDFEKPSEVVEFVASNLDYSKPLEVIVGLANEFPPGAFNLAMAQKKQEGKWQSLPYSSLVVTIEIFPTSRYFTNDYKLHNSWQIAAMRQMESDPTLTLVARKKFKELDVEATIYGRK